MPKSTQSGPLNCGVQQALLCSNSDLKWQNVKIARTNGCGSVRPVRTAWKKYWCFLNLAASKHWHRTLSAVACQVESEVAHVQNILGDPTSSFATRDCAVVSPPGRNGGFAYDRQSEEPGLDRKLISLNEPHEVRSWRNLLAVPRQSYAPPSRRSATR